MPLVNYETVIKFIRTTKTETGLRCRAYLDRKQYETGNHISSEQKTFVNLKSHRVLPQWNYTIIPHKPFCKTEKQFFDHDLVKGFNMKEAEVITKTENVRVRIMSLEPREIADWHYHTEVTDDIFCLTGMILVQMQEPEEENKLMPGQRCQVKTGRIHQVNNLGDEEATYLLIQGTGKYDFNIVHK